MTTDSVYLNGRFVQGPNTESVINPATGDVVGSVSTVNRDAVCQAIEDADGSFPLWRAMSGKRRGAYLLGIAEQMEWRQEEIARTITLENGKPLVQSRGEVAMSVDHLRWFAEEAKRAYGRSIPCQITAKRHWVVKSPIGVVGAISPWNFPMVLAVRKVAPALAAGCPVVLKPAIQTPMSAIRFAECVHAAELPPGVFQLVLGPAPMIGEVMLTHPKCRKITFTGSTHVGKQLIAGAAAQVKHLSLELGGNAPALVFNDANTEQAVEGVITAKFRNNGQSCIAANRIYVQSGIYDRFVTRFVAAVRALRVGNGLEEDTDVSTLINKAAMDHAMMLINDATEKGGSILCGGQRIGDKGYFLSPTVIADVPENALCLTEEIFAPIAPLLRFDDEAEVLEQANDSSSGLAAYVFSKSLDRVIRMTEGLEAGTIGVNDGAPTTSVSPFGGLKESGWGRELGIEGLEEFLETKHISIGMDG